MNITSPNLFEPLPIDAPLNPRPITLDHALTNLCGVFDRYRLFAVPPGTQADAVPPPFVTETNSDHYLRRLAASSIAVNLGGHPGLAAIRFADRSSLDEFLSRNSSCAETLVTAHAAGLVVWIRAVTAYRVPLELPPLHVQMAGSVLVFDRHALHCRDEFLHLADIKIVDLFTLDWGPDPDGQIAAWLVTLTHGEFVRRTQRRRILPRRDAWRDYLLRRLKPTTAFDRATGGFWRRLNGEVWQPVDEFQMQGEIRQLVISAPILGLHAHTWCNDEWLVGMLRYLRRVLMGEVPFVINHVRAFARGALVISPGQDVTVPELNVAFVRYCRERTLPLISKESFQKLIPKVLSEPPWERAKSKSVRRASGAQNGFRGIALRSSFAGRAT